jgi:hypothetical protein
MLPIVTGLGRGAIREIRAGLEQENDSGLGGYRTGTRRTASAAAVPVAPVV